MIDQEKIKNIKIITEEFFVKMDAPASKIEASLALPEKDIIDSVEFVKEVVNLDITLDEPQIFIGQGGQTLLEIQRLLRMVLNKKEKEVFYVNLDINGYKRKKIEYLKDIAISLADEVFLTKQEKELIPMSSYERRIVHAELARRTDVITESRGEGQERRVVIKPKI
jgi:spoIIIJ-associated protein